ncbi:hypothetical protein ILYODFUR_014557 [Ilyodon furcidens]|uniref:Uncharacterized protein n=1 Tax=Ilyodon furcidens TaxID=33524 RepID=A0ABV0U5F3_9TELE
MCTNSPICDPNGPISDPISLIVLTTTYEPVISNCFQNWMGDEPSQRNQSTRVRTKLSGVKLHTVRLCLTCRTIIILMIPFVQRLVLCRNVSTCRIIHSLCWTFSCALKDLPRFRQSVLSNHLLCWL